MLSLDAIYHTKTPPELRDLYISGGRLKKYPRNSKIVTQGELIHNCYYLNNGFCAYMHIGYDGSSRAFNLITKGSSFGETPSMLHEPAVMNVVCLEDTIVYETSFDRLLQGMSKEQIILLTKYTVRVNLGVRWMLQLFTTLNITQRILVFLKIYANNTPDSCSEWQTLNLKLTHDKFAEIIGAGRVAVTVHLNNLKRMGYIRTQGSVIQFDKNILTDGFILNDCRNMTFPAK